MVMPFRHHIEEWDGKFARRKSDQDAGAALTSHADALFEGAHAREP